MDNRTIFDTEPNRTKFFEGIRELIREAGNKILLYDKIVMYMARKS